MIFCDEMRYWFLTPVWYTVLMLMLLMDLDVFTSGASLMVGLFFCPVGADFNGESVPFFETAGVASTVFFGASIFAPFLDGGTLFSVFGEVSTAALCHALMVGTLTVSQFIGTAAGGGGG